MSDELKRLAEAATPGHWSARTDDLGYALATVGQFRIIVGSAPADDPEPDALFIAAANPAAVLALIAENEILWSDNVALAEARTTGLISERRKLKAEVEALRKDAERYRWLRLQHNDPGSSIAVECSEGLLEDLSGVSPDTLDLDTAIEAAMTKEQPK